MVLLPIWSDKIETYIQDGVARRLLTIRSTIIIIILTHPAAALANLSERHRRIIAIEASQAREAMAR